MGARIKVRTENNLKVCYDKTFVVDIIKNYRRNVMKQFYSKPECKLIMFEEACILTSSADKDGSNQDFLWEGLSYGN